jgi:hypothetical protein
MCHALLGDDPSLAPLTRLLSTRTGGNPFFLEESVRTLVEIQVCHLGRVGQHTLPRGSALQPRGCAVERR